MLIARLSYREPFLAPPPACHLCPLLLGSRSRSRSRPRLARRPTQRATQRPPAALGYSQRATFRRAPSRRASCAWQEQENQERWTAIATVEAGGRSTLASPLSGPLTASSALTTARSLGMVLESLGGQLPEEVIGRRDGLGAPSESDREAPGPGALATAVLPLLDLTAMCPEDTSSVAAPAAATVVIATAATVPATAIVLADATGRGRP